MALHINNPEVERNVRALAAMTGESLSEAVNEAAKARLRLIGRPDDTKMVEDVRAILRRFDELTVVDKRTADEMLGYDDNGLPR